MHPSIELRRQDGIGHGAGVAEGELRAACCALLGRDSEGCLHLPALESRSIVGRAQRRNIELQGHGWVQQRRKKRGCGEDVGVHCYSWRRQCCNEMINLQAAGQEGGRMVS